MVVQGIEGGEVIPAEGAGVAEEGYCAGGVEPMASARDDGEGY